MICLTLGSLIYLAILRFGIPEQPARMAGPVFLLLVCAFALYCNRRGKVRLGLLGLGIGLWSEITLTAVITGGTQAPALYLYPLIILMAGWLYSLRMAYTFALLSVAASVGLAAAASMGILPQSANRPLLYTVIQSGALIFASVIISRIVSSYRARLDEVEALSRELGEAQRIGRVGNWAFDIPNRRMAWSDEMYRIYECEPGSFDGSFNEILSHVHPDDVPGLVSLYRNPTATAGQHEHKHRILTKDGRIKTIHSRWELLCETGGRPVRVFGTAQDITEQEEARAEIQRLNASLEQRVKERTAELTAANRELESFAYSISHDLRGPLRGIDGFSHMLREEYGGKIDEQGRGYIERVRKAVQRMGTLIDDILELSRVTRREMHRTQVDLSRLATELVEEISRARAGRRVNTVISPGCQATGDPQLLRLLLQNLLENAWKYTGWNPAAQVEFGCESAEGKPVYFVKDNGVGFDMQHTRHLFAPFQRLHTPEEFEGSGIGLATVARIVDRHGGRIWAESKPGKGTTFRFTLR